MPAHTEIWFAEYDAPCVEQHRDKLHALNVKAVTGDQGDPATVYRWGTNMHTHGKVCTCPCTNFESPTPGLYTLSRL